MSRHFSSAARIIWTFNGTTRNLERDVAAVEQAVEAYPELAKKVAKGLINGDPHATKYADGTEDPVHISGILGQGNLKGSKRAKSFHYYLATGDVRFSNSKYSLVRVGTSNNEAESPSTAQLGAQIPAHQLASDWVWDEGAQKYRYWSGFEWVWQE